MRALLPFLALPLLAACVSPPPSDQHPYEDYLRKRDLTLPRPDDFQHCRAYGCAIRDRVSLDKREWNAVRKNFRGVKTAPAERLAIAKAVGQLERTIGPITNTNDDLGGTFRRTGADQMDCVDESLNTTMYLAMMENDHLLKFHQVRQPAFRTPMATMGNGKFWPHFTAVITDNKTDIAWAVDSWARDNGYRADVLPLSDWSRGLGPGEDSDPRPKD